MTREEFIKEASKKKYIGDSVYVHYDGYHFILETRNGLPDDPSNTIAIEHDVLKNLLNYKEQIYAYYEKMRNNNET